MSIGISDGIEIFLLEGDLQRSGNLSGERFVAIGFRSAQMKVAMNGNTSVVQPVQYVNQGDGIRSSAEPYDDGSIGLKQIMLFNVFADGSEHFQENKKSRDTWISIPIPLLKTTSKYKKLKLIFFGQHRIDHNTTAVFANDDFFAQFNVHLFLKRDRFGSPAPSL